MKLSEWYNQGTEQTKAAKKLALVAMGIAGLATLGVFGGLLVSGIVNAVILGVVGLFGIVGIQLAPLFSRYLTLKGKNFLLDAAKREAAANPITTRQQLWMERGTELDAAEGEIADNEGEIETFASQLIAMRRDFPNEDHSDMEKALEVMKQAQEQMTNDLAQAKQDHEDVGKKIQFASRKWEAAKRMDKIMARLDPQGQHAIMNKILEEVAIESTETKFNASLGKLKISMATRTKPAVKAIEVEIIPPLALPKATKVGVAR